jgi:hypothetical protein
MTTSHFVRMSGPYQMPIAACGDHGYIYRNPDMVTCKKCRRTKAWKKAHALLHGEATEEKTT